MRSSYNRLRKRDSLDNHPAFALSKVERSRYFLMVAHEKIALKVLQQHIKTVLTLHDAQDCLFSASVHPALSARSIFT